MISPMTHVPPLGFPSDRQALPAGHPGLRGLLLVLLKKSQGLTAKQLAVGACASLNAVRHHLKELEADRLVSYERQHHGVGAPSFAYRLTAAGQALFPRRYEATLSEVLDHVVEQQGREAAVALLEARYDRLTRELTEELRGLDTGQRLGAVAEFLSADGYMAEARPVADGGTLTQHNCAVQSIAERFPELCAAEAKFLTAIFGGEVHRDRHILAGCSACEYRVRLHPAERTTRPEEIA